MSCYTSDDVLEGYELVCVDSGECVEVLVVRASAYEKIPTLGGELTGKVFSVGVHSARVCRDEFKPLLGLLNVLRGRVRRGYVVVNEKSEKVFLYGRDILPEGVLEMKPSGCKGVLVVLNKKLEPIGWARASGGGVIKNMLDLGWYLRSGI